MTKSGPPRKNQRSKAQLGDIFWQLLRENPEGKITLATFCQAAKISPKTFHRFFSSLEELARFELAQVASSPVKPSIPIPEAKSEKPLTSGVETQSMTDLLNNLPVGVCVLCMPDETHQEVRFANKQ